MTNLTEIRHNRTALINSALEALKEPYAPRDPEYLRKAVDAYDRAHKELLDHLYQDMDTGFDLCGEGVAGALTGGHR